MTTSPDAYLLAATILSPDELPKLALVTYDASSPASGGSSTPPVHTQRIFVIVSNVTHGVEQSCVLVIKPRRKDPATAVLLGVIPILPNLSIHIEPLSGLATSSSAPAAARLGLSTLPQGLPSIHKLLESIAPGSSTAETSNAALKLTLSHGTSSASGITSDVTGLKDFLSVLKDLLFIASEHSFGKDTHQWMAAYTDAPASTAAPTPIFSRFSHSSFLPRSHAVERPASPTASDVRISVGTFNVNGHLPPEDVASMAGLKKWIRAEHDPDLLVLGFQEVDNSSGAYLYHSPAREDAWVRLVAQALGRRAERYRKVASKQLVGLLILVFAREELVVEEVATASVGVGLGGFVANKGAVAVRMKVGERTLCFVNSHLGAFEGLQAMERRCWDWSEIYKRLRFRLEVREGEGVEDFWETPASGAAMNEGEEEGKEGEGLEKEEGARVEMRAASVDQDESNRIGTNGISDEDHQPPVLSATNDTQPPPPKVADELSLATSQPLTSSWPTSSPPSPSSSPPAYTSHAILSHDVVLHLGDLNFRLDLSHSEAHRLIRSRDFPTLYRYDQLESLRTSGSLFDDFEEGRIAFAPTYKFDKGTDRYDTSEKHRVPAWTDRVLWCVTREWEDDGESATKDGDEGGGGGGRRKGVVLQEYDAVTELKFSDHRPVRATFLVRVR